MSVDFKTENVTKPSSSDGATKTIVFFLVPNFSMIAFATAIEPLRMANRMRGDEMYQWRLCSLNGEAVTASNGVEVTVDTALEKERQYLASSRRPNIMFAVSGIDVELAENKSLTPISASAKTQA